MTNAITLNSNASVKQTSDKTCNVPTSDILDKGKVYFELDVAFKTNDDAVKNSRPSFRVLLVGAGGKVENRIECDVKHTCWT